MKKNLLSLAAILSIGFFTNNVEAQTSVTSEATAVGARLIKPMTIAKVGDLNFGTINVLNGASGSVTLNPKDAIRAFVNTVDGVVGNIPASTPTYSVTGTKNATYAVSLPQNGTITVTEIGTGNIGATMAINDFVASFGSSNEKTTTTNYLSFEGLDSFKVGATLVVKVGQETGIYAGSFNVSVDYN